MQHAVLLPLLCAALTLLLPARAPAAGVPEKDEGTVTVLVGGRSIPQGEFLDQQSRAGLKPGHHIFDPGVLLQLGFQPDDDLHVHLDFGYGLERYTLTSGDLQVRSLTILLGADSAFFRSACCTLYGGGGLGYSLNTTSRQGRDQENNSTAGFIELGLRVRLGAHFALVVQDRYTLSSTVIPELNSGINVGGNLLAVGLQLRFASPADKGHPAGPTD